MMMSKTITSFQITKASDLLQIDLVQETHHKLLQLSF